MYIEKSKIFFPVYIIIFISTFNILSLKSLYFINAEKNKNAKDKGDAEAKGEKRNADNEDEVEIIDAEKNESGKDKDKVEINDARRDNNSKNKGETKVKDE